MKANELRIGNLIYGISDRVETILEIKEKSLVTYAGKIKDNKCEFEFKYFEPIPLTEYWLLKFGAKLEKTKDNDWYFFENIYVNCGFSNIGKTEYWYMYEASVPIRFVHELQNLIYALTGEELIINEKL